jgi:hypothetical protein
MEDARNMDPKNLHAGDQITHPDFGVGTFGGCPEDGYVIDWDRQGPDLWEAGDKRWEQVELA